MDRRALGRFAWLSIAAAVVTIALKTVAYVLTHSVGLFSDALESLVNLAGALMALAMLTAAARPPDEGHAYGHGKAEYFSSVVEGTLIFLAAISIAVAAIQRIFVPKALEQIGLGLGVSIVASAINLAVALVVLSAGRRHRSITLEANARHLLTDVYTSVGVVAGVAAVALTGIRILDPLIALAVAGNVVWSGIRLIRMSVSGLMDAALPPAEMAALKAALERYTSQGIQYHALRTRESGSRRFVSLHVLVPGDWTVHRGHRLLERIEADIRGAVPDVSVFTHLESLDDPASWDDQALDRPDGPPRAEPRSS
ncbi:MAG TPA: cation diffusion facilitator family transporter [Candidatus Polarisedimenticolaceae bacterium]|nr:cation diffusion facilitator family transporter [Candidatus Polarisedimenticolaceae bacterium]